MNRKMALLSLLWATLFLVVALFILGLVMRLGLRYKWLDCDDIALAYSSYSTLMGIPHDIRYGRTNETAHVWVEANTTPSITVFELEPTDNWIYTDNITYYRLWQFVRSDFGYQIPDLQ